MTDTKSDRYVHNIDSAQWLHLIHTKYDNYACGQLPFWVYKGADSMNMRSAAAYTVIPLHAYTFNLSSVEISSTPEVLIFIPFGNETAWWVGGGVS